MDFSLNPKPESLFNMSLEAACHLTPAAYQSLPSYLKQKLLSRLSERGSCCDESIQILIFPSLQGLDLRKCSISEVSLLCIEDLNDLKCLWLPQSPSWSYSETALAKIVVGKSHLRTLGMSWLEGVTDKVVKSLVKCSHGLESLNVEGTEISDESLFHLRNLSSLSNLNVSNTKISDSGVEELTSGDCAKSLIFVRVKSCEGLTNHSLRNLVEFCPQLCIFPEDLSPKMSVRVLDKLMDMFRSSDSIL